MLFLEYGRLLHVCGRRWGSGRLKGRVALAPDPVVKNLGGLLWPMFFIELDSVLRGWWQSRLVNAFW
jgi:hypothetical protein